MSLSERLARNGCAIACSVALVRLARGPCANTSRSARSGSPVSAQPLEQSGQVLGLHRVGGEPRPQRVAVADAVAGQAEIHAEAAAEVAAADGCRRHPGKKPMPTSGMANMRVLGQHAVRAVERNADAAAHDDAVDQRDIGLSEARDRGVQPVLVGEEIDRRIAGAAGFVDVRGCRRRPRTPCPRALMTTTRDGVVVAPGVERARSAP